jgi:hypothetical protein
MTGETLRRSNWTAHELPVRRSQLEARPVPQEDPLAELERIVARGDPFAERPRTLPSNVEPFPARREVAREERPALRAVEQPRVPPLAPEARPDDLFGVDEAAFEAALRGSTSREPAPQSPAPAPIEPRFTEFDVTKFERELAGLQERPAVPRMHPPGVRSVPYAAPEPMLPQAAAVPPPAEVMDEAFLSGLDRELSVNEPAVLLESADPAPELEPEPRHQPEPHRRTGAITIAAVLGLVALGVGGAVGFTMVTGGARSPAGEPVVVRADDRPTRVVPPPQDDPGKVIQDRLNAQTPQSAERVVPREEEPVQALTQPTRLEPRTGIPQGAEPRRVQTTTIRVRPDGTMESEPTRPAGTQLAGVPSGAPTGAVAPAVPAPRPVEQAAAPVPAAPVALAAPAAVPAPAPPPVRRDRPQAEAPLPAAAPTRVAAANPAETPAAARPSAGPFVQISSQPSQDAARNAFSDLQRRFPQVLGGRQSNIRSATVGERTIYRVRVGGFGSRTDAIQFCERLRGAGGDCFVVPN